MGPELFSRLLSYYKIHSNFKLSYTIYGFGASGRLRRTAQLVNSTQAASTTVDEFLIDYFGLIWLSSTLMSHVWSLFCCGMTSKFECSIDLLKVYEGLFIYVLSIFYCFFVGLSKVVYFMFFALNVPQKQLSCDLPPQLLKKYTLSHRCCCFQDKKSRYFMLWISQRSSFRESFDESSKADIFHVCKKLSFASPKQPLLYRS